MEKKVSPFTWTPGIAGKALIKTHYADDIISNFDSDSSYKYVYKIVGLRGSGKSVEYSAVCNYFRAKDNWLVYTLSAGGNPTKALIAQLSKCDFIEANNRETTYTTEMSASGGAVVISGNLSSSISSVVSENEKYYSDEVALKEMVKEATKRGYKVLVGIDDIAKTREMTEFLSILGSMFMESDKAIYLICTGLAKNIEDFVEEPHLSFFVRGDSIEITTLNLHDICYMYQKLLGVSQDEAVELAKFTNGYAYAYQVLGEIYYKKNSSEKLNQLYSKFDQVMGSQYDLIWDTLTEGERALLKIALTTDGKSESIKKEMDAPGSYNSLRNRLIKKHVIDVSERGMIKVRLPRFKEYIEYWK